MELKWLEDFVVLTATLSFSRAAQERAITQSAFSRRIKQLENWLGVLLVNRATFPAELTKEGKAFLPVAQEAIRNFYSTRDTLRPKGPRADVVAFAALQTLAVTFFPQWLRDLERNVEPLRSKLVPDRGGIEDNVAMLVDGDVDFFLTYAHSDVPFFLDTNRFPFIDMGEETLLPVSLPDPEGPPLDRCTETGKPVPYLSYGEYSFFGVALAKRFSSEHPFKHNVVHENTISVALKAMALAGWGVAWLPEKLVEQELLDGRLAPASRDPRWNIDVTIRIYRHAVTSRPVVERLWRGIRDLHTR
ncbi:MULTISPECIES: LysR family transcriptional regulator [unclassified Rhizobium]|uniref:LysR family transcriptional regulator n=1 Tax=unclassified Rhizobium TaxID=2613769 RepID=UPI0006FBB85F|nr:MULTISPECIES: LysR family transcriptional regulator [unclassified Rhizobium]KQV42743.1 LysR family transcriptional regulator [Rhizobium sp. Root1212]KRD36477.1 LysR family transcriptional regulator [Rhizobium sp. Root268]